MSEYFGEEIGERELTSIMLSPPTKLNENILFRPIQEWLNGGCSAPCPHVYDDLPAHDNVRIVTVNNVDIYGCNGTLIVSGMKFKLSQPPPFLQFDVSFDLGQKINDLLMAPKKIEVLGAAYTLTVSDAVRDHFIGYIYHAPSNSHYYYDGLHPEQFGKIANLRLKNAKLSLLYYFRGTTSEPAPDDGTEYSDAGSERPTETYINKLLQHHANPYAKIYETNVGERCRSR